MGRIPGNGTGPGDALLESIWDEATQLETLLVVHCLDPLREALAGILEYHGYRVLSAATVDEAAELARSERPALVLLDMAMREQHGEALAVALATDEMTRAIPILALSSDHIREETLRRCGISAALLMPTPQDDLLRAIDRLLEQSRASGAIHPPARAGDEQCLLELGDRLRSEHVTLWFRFHGAIRIEVLPANEPVIAEMASRLSKLGIQAEVRADGRDLLLSYELSVAQAFALGYNEAAPDELFFALVDAFPELGTAERQLRLRIRELESEFRRLRRIAS